VSHLQPRGWSIASTLAVAALENATKQNKTRQSNPRKGLLGFGVDDVGWGAVVLSVVYKAASGIPPALKYPAARPRENIARARRKNARCLAPQTTPVKQPIRRTRSGLSSKPGRIILNRNEDKLRQERTLGQPALTPAASRLPERFRHPNSSNSTNLRALRVPPSHPGCIAGCAEGGEAVSSPTRRAIRWHTFSASKCPLQIFGVKMSEGLRLHVWPYIM